MKNKISIIFCLLFVGIIVLPISLFITDNAPKKVDILENKSLKQFPDFAQLSYNKWASEFEEYFSDNLPFRNQAIRLFLRIWEYELYTPNRFALRSTKSGTLFPYSTIMFGTAPYPKNNLYKLRALFVGRQAFFTKYNIPYALMLAPDKETTRYKELPDWAIEPRLNFIYPQLINLLKSAEVNVLPLLEELQKYPPEKLAQNKADIAHWSTFGAITANELYSQEMQKIYPETQLIDFKKDFKFPEIKLTVGPFLLDTYTKIEFASPKCFALNTQMLEANQFVYDDYAQNTINNGKISVTNTCSSNNLYLFVSYDSFFVSGSTSPAIENGYIWPNAIQVKYFTAIDNANFSYTNMKKIVNATQKPDFIAEGHGERDVQGLYIRNYQPEVNLLGEKFLGTLQFTIEPKTFSMLDIIDVDSISLIKEEEEILVKTNNGENTALLIKNDIKTNNEGYAVIAAKIVSEKGGVINLKYRHKGIDEPYKVLSLPIMANNPFIYFQILDEANALFEAQIVLQKNQEYQFQAMDFLDELEGVK